MARKQIGVLTGGSGLIGGTIVNFYKTYHPETVDIRAPSSKKLSLREEADIKRYLLDVKPDFVINAAMANPHAGNGAGALATVLFYAPEAEAQLGPARDLLSDTAGASLIQPNLLVARLLARDSYELRQSLVPVLTRLRGRPLPRPWMI